MLQTLLVLTLIALAVCSVGWKKWFISSRWAMATALPPSL